MDEASPEDDCSSPRPSKRARTTSIDLLYELEEEHGQPVPSEGEHRYLFPAPNFAVPEDEEMSDPHQIMEPRPSPTLPLPSPTLPEPVAAALAVPRFERGKRLQEACLGEVYQGYDRETGEQVCIKRAARDCVAHEYSVTFDKRPFGFKLDGPSIHELNLNSQAEKKAEARELICGSTIVAINDHRIEYGPGSEDALVHMPPQPLDMLKGEWVHRSRGLTQRIRVDINAMQVIFIAADEKVEDTVVPLEEHNNRYTFLDYELRDTGWEEMKWGHRRVETVYGGLRVGHMVRMYDLDRNAKKTRMAKITKLLETEMELMWHDDAGKQYSCITTRRQSVIWRRPVTTQMLLDKAELPCTLRLRSPDCCLRKDAYGRTLYDDKPCYRSPQLLRENFAEECRIHQLLSSRDDACPYLAKFLGTVEGESELCNVMEMIRGGDLFDQATAAREPGGRALTNPAAWELLCKRWFTQMLECIAWMHKSGYCHLDVSLENVMLTERNQGGEVRIIDLGVALDYNSRARVSDAPDGMAFLNGMFYYVSDKLGRPRYKHHERDIYLEYGEKGWQLVSPKITYLVAMDEGSVPPQQGWVHAELTPGGDEDMALPVNVHWVAPRAKRSHYYTYAHNGRTTRVGKQGYMAPEVWQRGLFDAQKADVWSLGVTLMCMLVGAPPWEEPSAVDKRFNAVVNQRRLDALFRMWKLDRHVSREVVAMLQRIFSKEAARPTAAELFEDPWLAPPTILKPEADAQPVGPDEMKQLAETIRREQAMLTQRGFWRKGVLSDRFDGLDARLKRLESALPIAT